MNTWMSHTFAYPETPLDRGKRARRRDAEARRRVGALPGRRRRRHSVPDAYRATACRRTSRAAPATTTRDNTASARTTTCTTWSGWPASSRPRARYVPKPEVADRARRRDRHHRVRHAAIGRSRRAGISWRVKPASRARICALRAYPFTDELAVLHRPLQARLCRRAEPRRADAAA